MYITPPLIRWYDRSVSIWLIFFCVCCALLSLHVLSKSISNHSISPTHMHRAILCVCLSVVCVSKRLGIVNTQLYAVFYIINIFYLKNVWSFAVCIYIHTYFGCQNGPVMQWRIRYEKWLRNAWNRMKFSLYVILDFLIFIFCVEPFILNVHHPIDHKYNYTKHHRHHKHSIDIIIHI